MGLLIVVDEGQKKKRAKFVFKLTKTVNQDSYANEEEATTPLLKLGEEADNKHFVLEQHSKKRKSSAEIEKIDERETETNGKITEDLPPEIAQMVSAYLKINKDGDEAPSKQKKPSKKHFTSEIARLPSLDYVYDIYHLEQIPEDEIATYPRDDIGFIKIVNKDLDLLPDSETDSNLQISDDEDSNDENYYQNDYPEDEDDDRSVLFGSDDKDEELSEDLEWAKLAEEPSHGEDPHPTNLGDYSDIFNKLEGSSDILASLKNSNVVDLDMTTYNDEVYDEEEAEMDADIGHQPVNGNNADEGDDLYERNEFFSTDKDDPLAQHRDKIFGRLQKMIKEHK